MAKTTRPVMDLPAFITYWLDQGKTFEEIADENVPRSTVDWDTSQADDFRTRGEPWTIKRTRLERGRARRSERQGLARWRSGAAAGCHASARVRQCCGCCAGKTWKL